MALSYSPLSTVTSPMKSADFKELEELASTDSGEESVAQQLSFSADSASSDGEALASSDGEALDDTHSHADTGFLVYSTAILLQLRAAFGKVSSPSSVTYGTRSYAELPQELPAPQQTRTPAAAGSKQQNRTRAAVASQNKEKKSPAVRSESGEEDSWRSSPKKKAERTGPPAALAPRTGSDDEKFTRAIRSILNKLTVEKFDALYEQVATCGVQTPGHITILMADIFEKATAQHHFIPMYADLCVRLGNDERITQAAESEGQSNSFRRLLLGQCQAAFESLLKPTSGKDDEEANCLRKKRALGNVKLVGEIMNRGMLSSKLLCGCAEGLLAEHEECAEALESLAAFLTVVGGKFDVASWQYHPKLEAIFGRVQELTVDKKVPSRTRFLLRDVLDLRRAGWPGQMRPTMQGSGPMKLDEVQQQQGSEERSALSSPKSKDKQAARPSRNLKEKVENGNRGAWNMGKERSNKANNGKDMRVKDKTERPRRDKTTIEKSTSKKDHVERRKSERPKMESATPVQGSTASEGPHWTDGTSELAAFHRALADAMRLGSAASDAPPEDGTFELPEFHHALAEAMRDLRADRDVDAAVGKVCAWDVPAQYQAKEFADVLTRALEETRGPVRRSALAFAAGLASEPGAFLTTECAVGAVVFFHDIYEQMCTEVPHLDAIAAGELVPMLRSVLPAADLQACLPEDLQV